MEAGAYEEHLKAASSVTGGGGGGEREGRDAPAATPGEKCTERRGSYMSPLVSDYERDFHIIFFPRRTSHRTKGGPSRRNERALLWLVW